MCMELQWNGNVYRMELQRLNIIIIIEFQTKRCVYLYVITSCDC